MMWCSRILSCHLGLLQWALRGLDSPLTENPPCCFGPTPREHFLSMGVTHIHLPHAHNLRKAKLAALTFPVCPSREWRFHSLSCSDSARRFLETPISDEMSHPHAVPIGCAREVGKEIPFACFFFFFLLSVVGWIYFSELSWSFRLCLCLITELMGGHRREPALSNVSFSTVFCGEDCEGEVPEDHSI